MLYTGKWNGIMIDVIYAGARGYIKKKRFSYPKPFSDICYTYDGLVSTVLSRLTYCESGFFMPFPFFHSGSYLLFQIRNQDTHC